MEKINKTEGVVTASTALKIIMLSIEEEETIAEGFAMRGTECEQFEDESVAIIGKVTTDFTWFPNYIGDTIKSYTREYVWENYEILIVNYNNTEQLYKTIKVELYELMNTYGTNTKDKNERTGY